MKSTLPISKTFAFTGLVALLLAFFCFGWHSLQSFSKQGAYAYAAPQMAQTAQPGEHHSEQATCCAKIQHSVFSTLTQVELRWPSAVGVGGMIFSLLFFSSSFVFKVAPWLSVPPPIYAQGLVRQKIQLNQ